MGSKNSLISKLARNLDATGDITADAIATTVSLGAEVYSSRANLPASGNTAGDQAFTTDTNRLYIWNGSGWYNVALLNVAPAISAVTDSDGGVTPFALSIDGTATTITITAADSDGDPITYNATTDSDFGGLASISQDSSVFTITPLSQDSATTESGTITFTATDGVNVASSGVQTFTLQFVSSYWDETALSIGTSSTNSLDNSTFIDRSTNASTVTTSGTPIQTAFHPYLDKWSVEFKDEGSNGWGLELPSTTFDNPSNTFTVEAWGYLKSYGTSTGGNEYHNRAIMGKGATYLNFGITSAGTIQLYHYDGSTRHIQSTSTVPLNEWHHIAAVVDDGTITFYLDGVSAGTGTWYGLQSGHVGTEFYVGTTVDTNANANKWWDGWLSNVRFVDGTAIVPSSGGNVPVADVTNTEFIMCSSNRFIDASSNDLSVTIYRTPKVSAFNPFGQKPEYAVGENKGSYYNSSSTTGYLQRSNIDFSTSNFTIQFWFYMTADFSTYRNFFGQSNGGGNNPKMLCYVSSSDIIFEFGSLGGTSLSYATSNFKPHEWYHMAFVREGTGANELTMYVNGVSVDTGQLGSTSACTGNFRIGQVGESESFFNDDFFQGYISDFYVSKTAEYTANFTVPSAPVGATNADYYLSMDNAGIFDKTGNNTLTLIGNVQTSDTKTKYDSTSIAYANDNRQVLYTYPSSISGDFTIEFWINPNNVDASQGDNILEVVSGTGVVFDIGGANNANRQRVWLNGTNIITGTSNGYATDEWSHVAITRSSNTVRLFKNGTLVGSSSSQSATLSGQQRIGGIAVSRYFDGYLEGFQVLTVAKYTTGFTPPTQTQGRIYQAES